MKYITEGGSEGINTAIASSCNTSWMAHKSGSVKLLHSVAHIESTNIINNKGMG